MLPIYLYGNPVLRKTAEEITLDYPDLSSLIDEMFDSMKKAEGVGLAAPQIGLSIRLFIIDTVPFQELYPNEEAIQEVFINPKIEEYLGEDFSFNEGCLSLPDIHEEVIRKSEVIISYTDRSGNQLKKHFKGMAARVIQHEYDHLEGLVFTDRVSQLKKMILKKKLSEISSGKKKPSYRSKL